MTLASKSEAAIKTFITKLEKHFKLCDLGPTDQLLGMKVDRDHSCHSLSLSQQRYTLEILQTQHGGLQTHSSPLGTGTETVKRNVTKNGCRVSIHAKISLPCHHQVPNIPSDNYSTRHSLCSGCTSAFWHRSWHGPLECSQTSTSIPKGNNEIHTHISTQPDVN